MSGRCLWCGRPFTFRKVGAQAKKFCSVPCKNRYNTALRQWAQQAVALGQLSVTDLKAVQASCTTHGEGNERGSMSTPIRTPRTAARRPVQAR